VQLCSTGAISARWSDLLQTHRILAKIAETAFNLPPTALSEYQVQTGIGIAAALVNFHMMSMMPPGYGGPSVDTTTGTNDSSDESSSDDSISSFDDFADGSDDLSSLPFLRPPALVIKGSILEEDPLGDMHMPMDILALPTPKLLDSTTSSVADTRHRSPSVSVLASSGGTLGEWHGRRHARGQHPAGASLKDLRSPLASRSASRVASPAVGGRRNAREVALAATLSKTSTLAAAAPLSSHEDFAVSLPLCVHEAAGDSHSPQKSLGRAAQLGPRVLLPEVQQRMAATTTAVVASAQHSRPATVAHSSSRARLAMSPLAQPPGARGGGSGVANAAVVTEFQLQALDMSSLAGPSHKAAQPQRLGALCGFE
jgi:hypothetical protein